MSRQPTTREEWQAYLASCGPLTVGVCGGRDYGRVGRVGEVLGRLATAYGIERLWHGACTRRDREPSGADWWCHVVAYYLGVEVKPYPANWDKHGKAAGPMRNGHQLKAEMERGPVHLLVAFPGGDGTADMVARARAAGVPVFEVPP